MKRPIFYLVCLGLLMLACIITTTTTPPTNTLEPAVTVPAAATDTVQPTSAPPPATTEAPTSQPPTATQPPVQAANVICDKLSLYLDPALASGYNCQTVPEAIGQGFIDTPEYTELTLQGYVLADRFHKPQIHVYPVQRFTDLAPDAVTGDINTLQALLSGGPQGENLPLLNVNVFGAGQIFHVQYRVFAFGSGNGIRYLTEYAQYFDPINNHDLFYTYQGLTADGKAWVSAILPISNPILPENPEPLPGGQTPEQFSNNYPTYITDMTNQLNGQTAGSFNPTLTALDALMSSVQIAP